MELQPETPSQRDLFRRRDVRIGALVGLVVGLLIGWFVLGWWLFPVRWVNARPSDLHPAWKKHYVAMVVDSYLVTRDPQAAAQRLSDFSDAEKARLLSEVLANFEARGGARQAQAARELAKALGIALTAVTPVRGTSAPATPMVTATAPAAAGQTEAAGQRPLLRRAAIACGIVLVVLALVAAAVMGFLRSVRPRIASYVAEPAQQPPRLIGTVNVGQTVTARYEGQGPQFEQSFQVYEGTDIVGECGLRALPVLARDGEVAVCAVWLYETAFPERSPDTCALVSEAVYEDEALRQVVEQDREAERVLLADPGVRVRLHHTNLTLEVEVIGVEYADPERYAFASLAVALRPILYVEEAEQPAEAES